MKIEEMVSAFQELSPQDKLAFFKQAMPSMCEAFRGDPQKMMNEMMPLCREMMESCGMDMEKMRGVMATMMQQRSCD